MIAACLTLLVVVDKILLLLYTAAAAVAPMLPSAVVIIVGCWCCCQQHAILIGCGAVVAAAVQEQQQRRERRPPAAAAGAGVPKRGKRLAGEKQIEKGHDDRQSSFCCYGYAQPGRRRHHARPSAAAGGQHSCLCHHPPLMILPLFLRFHLLHRHGYSSPQTRSSLLLVIRRQPLEDILLGRRPRRCRRNSLRELARDAESVVDEIH